MRIALITTSYPVCPNDSVGAGVFVRSLALSLASLGHQPFVFTPVKDGEIIPDAGVSVQYFKWSGGTKDIAHECCASSVSGLYHLGSLMWNGWRTVRDFARRNEVDYCLALWALPNGVFAKRVLKHFDIPYGVWALGSDIWLRRNYPFGELVLRSVLRSASHLLADGLELSSEVTRICGRECVFLPSSRRLDVEAVPPAVLKKDSYNLLFIGRWEEAKGVDLLPQTLEIVLKASIDAHLYIFGGGSLAGQLKEQIRKYGVEENITVRGYADPRTAIAYLKACHCLVVPSRLESIPVILSDATQCGIPVVVTDVGDMGMLVRKYGCGEVAARAAPEEIASALIRVYNQSTSAFLSGSAAFAADFDIDQTAQKFINMITE